MKTVHIQMLNLEQELVNDEMKPFLVDVTKQGSPWVLPYKRPISYADYRRNFIKYRHFVSNVLFIKSEPYLSSYNELMNRAQKDGKLIIACTCYPNICHTDALRERLTKDLEEKGFTVTSNTGPIEFSITEGHNSDEHN